MSKKCALTVFCFEFVLTLETMASSDDFGKKILLLHQELVDAYKKRFMCENVHVATIKCSPIWKNMRKDFKTFFELKSQVNSQIESWKQEGKSASAG